MSKLETLMTRWYWQQVGGTLVEEFCAVRRSRTSGVRQLDGLEGSGSAADPARAFRGGNAFFEIRSKTGKKVEKWSEVAQEREVIFDHGVRFKVISREQRGGAEARRAVARGIISEKEIENELRF